MYRGTTKAENPFYVGLYVAFFPQLIAGPIVQYNSIAEQIRDRKSSLDKISLGLSRFAVGVECLCGLHRCTTAADVFKR